MIAVIANKKGGVGKTTTAVNLSVCLGRRGRRVLAIDCDPQSTMTRQLGIEPRTLGVNLVDVLAGRASASNAVIGDVADGVDAIAGARQLAGVEMSVVGELGRERFLADVVAPLRDRYAVIVVDTPPNLGLLTVNALVCADRVIASVSCEDEASVQGLVELRGTLARLPRVGASPPAVESVLTRWSPLRMLSEVIEATVIDLGVAIAERIPARAIVGQAAAEHIPLAMASPDNCVTLAYERLADRLLGVNVA
jgi:chromosome partitioning protein